MSVKASVHGATYVTATYLHIAAQSSRFLIKNSQFSEYVTASKINVANVPFS